MSDPDFDDLLRRIRARDEDAITELFHHYRPIMCREIRARLTDPALYRLLDPEDVCQSVLKSFFIRAAAGQYDLQTPGQALALLLEMARNKVAYQARRHKAQCRDVGRTAAAPVEEVPVASNEPTPSRVVADKDLLATVRERLTEEERRIYDLQMEGRGWVEVAAALGETPDALRMRLGRALDRVTAELGLGDGKG
jgi:RNA polymerase sigma-70 factor (ECF subfamily)